jgi:predicted DNA-binding transcriptional regulator AlpA
MGGNKVNQPANDNIAPKIAANDNHKPIKLLRYCDLKDTRGITYSRRHLRRLEDTRKFPMRRMIGPKTPAWVESEVDGYLAAIVASRDKVPFSIAA